MALAVAADGQPHPALNMKDHRHACHRVAAPLAGRVDKRLCTWRRPSRHQNADGRGDGA